MISIATPAHRDRIVGSLVAAFPDDPVLRHLFPDDETYPVYAAAFFGHLFDKRVHRESIWMAGDGYSAAIWEPPALIAQPAAPATSEPTAPATSEPTAPAILEAATTAAPAATAATAVTAVTAALPPAELARMRAYDDAVHAALPAYPFWYLGVLGTHPDWTGRRWGHAVMAAGLRRAAEDGLPAILETSTPGNVEMYRRAGWQVIATVEHPLPSWIMQQ
ncbi:GNAT family N-acetyltransferase [Actinoplanes sp. NPDC023936]|uniref:GNAT family N-acetyltransferase n=1 Tax=Actinoplanes sp. NPDC023936 TaxID=3154910 RepID=UPI0033E9CEED